MLDTENNIPDVILENCRLCQEQKGSIFSENVEFEKKLQDFIPFRVTIYDELQLYLPCLICESCVKKIEEFSSFIKQITEVNKRLYERLKYLTEQLEYKVFESNTKKRSKENIELCLLEANIPKQCSICLKKFKKSKSERKNYTNHLKNTHHLIYCPKCCFVYNNKILLKHKCVEQKINQINTEINIEIAKTEEEFIDKSDLSDSESELKILSDDLKSFKCNECTKSFVSESKLKRHARSHSNPLHCPIENCGKECPTKYSFKVHLLTHESKRPFLCVTCGKGFTSKSSLTCHEKIHLTTKSYHCKLCNIGFSVRSNYRAHEKKYHEGVRFYCSQCTKEFLTKCSLDRHEKIHAGVKEYKCTNCPAEFYTNKELLKHQKYHQGLKPHKCEQCFKSFFERHHLVIHMRSHSGERPYKCNILGCDKSFVDSQKLKRHLTSRHTTSVS